MGHEAIGHGGLSPIGYTEAGVHSFNDQLQTAKVKAKKTPRRSKEVSTMKLSKGAMRDAAEYFRQHINGGGNL